MAIYECRDCDAGKFYPRRYTYHFGPHCRCPHCGTFRVTRLKAPDKIDRLHTGFLNFLERQLGGRLHHCRYCRIQFYDRRVLASEDTNGTTQERREPAPPANRANRDA
jgi:hypothetical protein